MEWKPIETAPKDRIIIAMGRYVGARCGAPSFVMWDGYQWCEFTKNKPEPKICWAWIDRNELPDWPDEP